MTLETGSVSNYNNRVQMFGMSSGLDIEGLINAQMQAERLKIDPYYTDVDNYTAEKNLWGKFKTMLNSVTTAADDIKNLTDVSQATKYSTEGVVNVTAKGEAVAGNYNISVQQIALAHKVMSDSVSSATAPLGYEGKLNIEGKDIDVTSKMSISDIAKSINKGGLGVDATVVGGHLFLTSQKTGVESSIQIQSVGGAKQASLSDTTAMTSSITGDISGLNSSYSLEIQQLATAQKVESNAYFKQDDILNYSGSFSINGKSVNVKTSDKLSDVVKNINATLDIGVKASIVNNKLVLEAKETGTNNAISLTDSTTSVDQSEGLFTFLGMTDGTNFKNVTQEATDAQYTIDGVAHTASSNTVTDLSGIELTLKNTTTSPVTLTIDNNGADIAEQLGLITSSGTFKNEIQKGQDAMYTIEGIQKTSSSNTITDAVQDMSFELLKESADPVQITVSQDSDALTDKMKTFVNAYNSAIQFINSYTGEGAALQGSSLLNNAKQTLRSILFDKGDNGMMMFQVGLEGDGIAKDGTIKLNETKFKEAVNGDYQNVLSFLTGTNGVANRFYEKMNEYTKSSGVIDTKTDSIDRSVKSLNDMLERKENAYDKLQESLVDKYSKLEATMTTLNSTLDILKAQIKSLSGDKDS